MPPYIPRKYHVTGVHIVESLVRLFFFSSFTTGRFLRVAEAQYRYADPVFIVTGTMYWLAGRRDGTFSGKMFSSWECKLHC